MGIGIFNGDDHSGDSLGGRICRPGGDNQDYPD
jgi:hypothetical protein